MQSHSFVVLTFHHGIVFVWIMFVFWNSQPLESCQHYLTRFSNSVHYDSISSCQAPVFLYHSKYKEIIAEKAESEQLENQNSKVAALCRWLPTERRCSYFFSPVDFDCFVDLFIARSAKFIFLVPIGFISGIDGFDCTIMTNWRHQKTESRKYFQPRDCHCCLQLRY